MNNREVDDLARIVTNRSKIRTHYDGCWRDADHRDCAIVLLLRELNDAREVLRQCWYWFNDHDDRLTSSEIHRMLKEVLKEAT